MSLIKSIALAAVIGTAPSPLWASDLEQKIPDSQPNEHPHEPNPRPERDIDKTLIDKANIRKQNGAAADAESVKITVTSQETETSIHTQKYTWATGVNAIWSYRADYGARTFRRFEPEVLGHLYQGLPWDHAWLRHGARIGYSNDQSQMPKALRIEESDWKASVEEGILWNWYVVPSLTAGIGYDWRSIRVKTKDPVISADNRINIKDSFFWSYIQAGAGIPILEGVYMIEPVVRRQFLAHDNRTKWAIGIEMTAAF